MVGVNGPGKVEPAVTTSCVADLMLQTSSATVTLTRKWSVQFGRSDVMGRVWSQSLFKLILR
jgi:hypothetical protein